MKTRSLLIGIFLGFVGYLLAAWAFPPLTLNFWRLARTDYVAFNGDGFGGGASIGSLERHAIAHSLIPETSFRLLFLVGTDSAQCYALAGLRDLRSPAFPAYLSRLTASKATVAVRWLDIGSANTVAAIAHDIALREESESYQYLKDYAEWRQSRSTPVRPASHP